MASNCGAVSEAGTLRAFRLFVPQGTDGLIDGERLPDRRQRYSNNAL